MTQRITSSCIFGSIIRLLLVLSLVFSYCLVAPQSSLADEPLESSAIEDADAPDLPSMQVEDTLVPSDETAPIASDDPDPKADEPSCAYDNGRTKTLRDNLVKRFSKGGADASLNTSTVPAAIALDSLGLAVNIDAAAIAEHFANFEAENGYAPGAGQYAKFILALTAAGIDCTKASIKEETRDLVGEMEALIEANGTPDVYSLVFILPVYAYHRYSAPTEFTDKLKNALLECQNDEGLFGMSSSWGDDYSSQTTAQAILALAPYKDDATVSTAVDKAVNKIIDMQLPDGSFSYYTVAPDWQPDLIATTADCVSALISVGIDCTGKNPRVVKDEGACPVGYLVAHADEGLNGFVENTSYDEPATASNVLMALAAQAAFTETGKAYDVYSGPVPASGSTDVSNPYTSPKTGQDDALVLFSISSLIFLALACIYGRRRCMQN